MVESKSLTTLEGLTTGRYLVTTYSGSRHTVDLEKRTAVRAGAVGHEWDGDLWAAELGGGGSRPKALIHCEHVTADGSPLHFLSIQDAEVGERMRLENLDEWRVTSEIISIEALDGSDV